jgi:hypothetical protein
LRPISYGAFSRTPRYVDARQLNVSRLSRDPAIDVVSLSETPPGAEGVSNSFRRWRRRESNPGPRSCGCGVYERSRRSKSRPQVASPAGLSGTSSLDVPGAAGANPLRVSLLIDPGAPPQASNGRDETQLPTKQPRNRDRNCASPHLFFFRVIYEAARNLGSQPPPRANHVEACRPLGILVLTHILEQARARPGAGPVASDTPDATINSDEAADTVAAPRAATGGI